MPPHPKDDQDVARFVRLLTRHERHLRSFLFHLVVGRDAVDEVMQEVSVVLWRKFAELESDDGFLKWAYVIARYEVLMYRRRAARDRLIFDEDVLNQLAIDIESSNLAEEMEQRQACLSKCLQRLEESDRRLLMAAYNQNERIVDLADRLNCSANSLYKTLGRLRRRLLLCIESQLKTS